MNRRLFKFTTVMGIGCVILLTSPCEAGRPLLTGESNHSATQDNSVITRVCMDGDGRKCYPVTFGVSAKDTTELTITSLSRHAYGEARFRIPPGFSVTSGCYRIENGMCIFSLTPKGSATFSLTKISEPSDSGQDTAVDTATDSVIDQVLQNSIDGIAEPELGGSFGSFGSFGL